MDPLILLTLATAVLAGNVATIVTYTTVKLVLRRLTSWYINWKYPLPKAWGDRPHGDPFHGQN